MERWVRVLVLSGACLLASGCASLKLPSLRLPFMAQPPVEQSAPTETPEEPPVVASDARGAAPSVISPTVKRTPVRQVRIEAEDFEIGPYVGALALEEFGMSPSYGMRVAYHISEDLFPEIDVGRSKAGPTSYERLTGDDLFPGNGRQITYYDLGGYYNLLPGEVFLGEGRALNSALYVGGSVGALRFGGNNHFTASVGAGYRVMVNDWLSLRADVRNRLMRSPIPGLGRASRNPETYVGFTVFF